MITLTIIAIILLIVTMIKILAFIIGHAIGFLGFLLGVVLLPITAVVMIVSGLAVGALVLLAAAFVGSFVLDLLTGNQAA